MSELQVGYRDLICTHKYLYARQQMFPYDHFLSKIKVAVVNHVVFVCLKILNGHLTFQRQYQYWLLRSISGLQGLISPASKSSRET